MQPRADSPKTRSLSIFLLLLAASAGTALAQSEAYMGQPFGIGRITVSLPADQVAQVWQTSGVTITEANNRIHYPAVTSRRVLRSIGSLLGVEIQGLPGKVNIYFLFTGEEPLQIAVDTPAQQQVLVTPRSDPNGRMHMRLLDQWWREYSAAARDQGRDADYPPLVQTYLTSMLSRRLGLETPLLSRAAEQDRSELQETMDLIMGAESLRMETLRRTAAAAAVRVENASEPIPPEIPWVPHDIPPPAPGVDIEPIATRVPRDCFYVRFGSFTNYLWLDKLQNEYGGDIGRMVTLRGYDAGYGDRIPDQLALKQSALADLLGPTVISDLAIFGRDLFVREGAAIGVLFQARNTQVLGLDFQQQRAESLVEWKDRGAVESTVKIAGRDVSLIATPDNRLRSFYVSDGDYHLTTNSRILAERFITICEAGGEGSLGASREFHHARSLMPTSRDDTVFAYLSSAFQQGLVSPQYQIELQRRLRAVTDIELVQLAQLAAQAEGKPSRTIEDLIRAELLPRGFGRRSDGSRTVVLNERLADSLRGGRGSFLPIPDVPISGLTPTEAAWYSRCAVFYGSQWQQMDPLILGAKRFTLDGKLRERVVIDGYISPFVDAKYGWLTSLLGPPTNVRIRPAKNDVITFQAAVNGGMLSSIVPEHHLFVGVQDHLPLQKMDTDGFLETLNLLRSTPGYLGAWPKPGFLDMLPFGLAGQPDAYGFSQLPFGLWRRQWDSFSALSFDPQLLADVTPQLALEQADDLAQVRLHADDLTQTKLAEWVNMLSFNRAFQASRGNVRLLNTLTQQLAVPRGRSLDMAERLLDAKLLCSLNGEFKQNSQTGSWSSTAWPMDGQVPAGYEAPLLAWFRGLDASLTKQGDQVVVHAQLDMQRQPSEAKIELPFFNLFGGDDESETQARPAPGSESPFEEIEAPPVTPPHPSPLPPPTPLTPPPPE